MASFNFPTPLIQLTVIHRPKLTTKLKILQNRISLAFLKQVFGQTHIWTKTVHLWRTRTFSSFKQIFFRFFNLPIASRNAPKHKIAVLNSIAVIPITLEFLSERK